MDNATATAPASPRASTDSIAQSPLRLAYANTGFLAGVASRAARYLTTIEDRKVAPSEDAVAAMSVLDRPLQDEPVEPSLVLDEFDRLIAPTTAGIAGPRFFGFVNGSSLPASLAVNWLSTAWDAHTVFHQISPGTVRLERIALKWIVDVLGLPAGCHGAFVTGTTMAHVTALAAARSALLHGAGWDVENDGLNGAPPLNVVVGDEAHVSLFKALGVVGLGRRKAIRVPVDRQGRLRPEAMPRPDGPTILCLQAGNVNTGASDPFRDAIPIARGWGVPLWVHVDGAFGLWAGASSTYRPLVDGVELADSWATDGHKWLNTPYDCGVAIMRDGASLYRSMSATAAYLPDEVANPLDHTPEMSRRPRGVDFWAALRSLGRRGVEELIDRNSRQARRVAEALREAGCTILNDVVLNQVLVSFGSAEETMRVVRGIQADGTCWCGGTAWQGQVAMRVSIVSWTTTDDDIERAIDAMLRVAANR